MVLCIGIFAQCRQSLSPKVAFHGCAHVPEKSGKSQEVRQPNDRWLFSIHGRHFLATAYSDSNVARLNVSPDGSKNMTAITFDTI